MAQRVTATPIVTTHIFLPNKYRRNRAPQRGQLDVQIIFFRLKISFHQKFNPTQPQRNHEFENPHSYIFLLI